MQAEYGAGFSKICGQPSLKNPCAAPNSNWLAYLVIDCHEACEGRAETQEIEQRRLFHASYAVLALHSADRQ